MLNPFVLFDKRFLASAKENGRHFLVAQSYKRVDDLFKEANKKYLLFSFYNDMGRAKQHLNVIKEDPLAAIVDLTNDKHMERMDKILQPDSDYILYAAFVQDKNEVHRTIQKMYSHKLKKYIDHYKQWHIPRDGEVKSDLEVTFGELYISLSYGRLNARVSLEQIENIR